MRRWTIGWCGALALGSLSCADPAVDVVAVWVDSAAAEDGSRAMQIYDAGDRYTLPVQPQIPGSSPELLRVRVDARGDGVAIAGERSTVYQSFREQRRPRFSPEVTMGRALARGFEVSRNGDAVFRGFEGDDLEELLMMVTTSEVAGTTELLETPTATGAGSFTFLTAADAPIFYWLEQGGIPQRLAGTVSALAYPSDHQAHGTVVTAPTVLGQGMLVGRGVEPTNFPRRAPDDWCPGRTCVSPDGRSLTAMTSTPCTLWWWSWEDGQDVEASIAPRFVRLPEGCPESTDPHLFAQLAHDVVVLDDDQRMYVADLTAHRIEAIPKLGDRIEVFMARRGRAVVMVSPGGQAVHVSADGVRLLATERSVCEGLGIPATRVSPNGLWVVQVCAAPDQDVPESQGLVAAASFITRISPLGLETFVGIAMAPLTIDDEGNVLLYSYESSGSSAEEPRGLFVLTADGLLARVDDLDPEPARITNGKIVEGNLREVYFSLPDPQG
jgi:hypothetical protein